jgi:hypothetical protein
MADQIERLANESYFMTADMIRFLLVENLALKTLLHKKNLINPEEYKECQLEAASILNSRVNAQIDSWKRDHPELIGKIKSIQESQSPQKEETSVVA